MSQMIPLHKAPIQTNLDSFWDDEIQTTGMVAVGDIVYDKGGWPHTVTGWNAAAGWVFTKGGEAWAAWQLGVIFQPASWEVAIAA